MRIRKTLAALLALCLLTGALPALMPVAEAAMPYYITVDITNQIVTVYENGNRTKSGIVAQMICSTGKSGHSTPTGTFALPKKSRSSERTEWYYFPAYSCYAKWATRIVGGILFHSVIYSYRGGSPTSTSVNALGSRASHGCVRLRVEDAKFIAKHCFAGTLTKVYYSGKYNSDLRSRLRKRSFYRSQESYNHFLGGNDTLPLSYGCSGTLVKRLQKRLRALGYFTGVLGGNYLDLTRSAVLAFQKDAGLSRTGVVTKAVWKKIFASNAPTGTRVTLSQGASGPVVKTMQKALKAAKCYSGPLNGEFDSATTSAVRKWQKIRGSSVTGKATGSMQRSMLKLAAQLKEEFGDTPYKLVRIVKKTPMAEATKQTGIYTGPSGSSGKLATLAAGSRVKVLEQGQTWSNVKSGSTTGYVKNAALRFYTKTATTYTYVAVETTPETPESAPDAVSGAPEDRARDIVIGADGAAMYPDAALSGSAIAEIPAGSVLVALEEAGDAVGVCWDGRTGYVAMEQAQWLDEAEPAAEAAESAEGDGLTLDMDAPEAFVEAVEGAEIEIIEEGDIVEEDDIIDIGVEAAADVDTIDIEADAGETVPAA